MSDEGQDVAVRVVSPSLRPSRHTPPPSCVQVSDRTTLTNEPLYEPDPYDNGATNEKDSVYSKESGNNTELDINSDHTRECFKISDTRDTELDEVFSSDDTIQELSSEQHGKISFEDYETVTVTSADTGDKQDTFSPAIMGNQSGKKKSESDEDTPDESRTKCCEIPKKKLKDRNSKISKSSRSEENDFDEDEVYPFVDRARTSADQDDRDTVELEPFEIIETDDIKFIAGAGTSDVIRNASESKFKAIPEEVVADEEEELRQFEEDEEIILKEAAMPIDKGDRILESGTSTAHSTFEFRQVKTKGKLKALREESQTVYENVFMTTDGDSEKPKPQLKPETSYTEKLKPKLNLETSKSERTRPQLSPEASNSEETKSKLLIESSKSEKTKMKRSPESGNMEKSKLKPSAEISNVEKRKPDFSQETSGFETTKPKLSRETSNSSSSSKSGSVSSSGSSKSSSRKNSKEPIPKPARKGKKRNESQSTYVNAEIQDAKNENNIDRLKESSDKLKEPSKKTNSVILTQTMFSNPKVSKEKVEVPISSPGSQTTYENVNLCAIMTPTGIVIGHRKSDTSAMTGNVINAAEIPKGEISSISSVKHASLPSQDLTLDNETLQNFNIETPIYETLGSGTIEEKTQGARAGIFDTEDKTVTSGVSGRITCGEENGRDKLVNPNVLQVDEEQSVPPPSPQGMEILAEEEEEEDEENEEFYEDEDDFDHINHRKDSEISDFTENICKRLSQLLETMPPDDDEPDDIVENKMEPHNMPKIDKSHFHIYEEVIEICGGSTDRKELIIETDTPEMISSVTKLDPKETIKRHDSASTLKRISCDSNTYPLTEFLGSSDDDLPEYFDPRTISDDSATLSVSKSSDSVSASAQDETYQKKLKKDDYIDMTLTGVQPPEISSNIPSQSVQSLSLSQSQKEIVTGCVTELQDITPTAEAAQEWSALPEYASVEEESSLQYQTCGRQSITYTESDLDISEHRDDLSTDSMLADDEDDETMEILFTKTYTEPEEGAEVFLSCTVVNSAYKEEKKKKSDTWLSDEALQYFETNAAEVMSTAFMKAKKEMKDIQMCIQNLRHQMEHFHGDVDDVSLPDMSAGSLSPDYFPRKAVTD